MHINIFLLAFLFVLLFFGYMRFEASWIQINKIRFCNDSKCLKIMHLSDIHIRFLCVPIKKIVEVIKNENPDIIFITGDFITSKNDVPAFLSFIDKINFLCPIMFTVGNHEYKSFKQNLKDLERFIYDIKQKGCILLDNESLLFEKDSNNYNIIGIGEKKYNLHDVNKALSNINSNFTKIAFTHNPDLILDLKGYNLDYLFCGHFHGGQIWMPFGLEFKFFRKESLCKMGITRGLHKINGINLYINRGLGNVLFPFRFLSRPEISIYYL